MSKALLVLVFTVGLASAAMAAGSPSTSRPPTPRQAPASDYDLGVKAVQAGDYARARALFQKVVQIDPRNADAWNNLGFSHRNLKQFSQSLVAYQKALAINPDHLGANEYLGELYLQIGNLEKTREQVNKLSALCPSGCKEADDLRKAIKAYESAQKKG